MCKLGHRGENRRHLPEAKGGSRSPVWVGLCEAHGTWWGWASVLVTHVLLQSSQGRGITPSLHCTSPQDLSPEPLSCVRLDVPWPWLWLQA